MRKFFALLSAVILSLAASVFAQDGATTLNYYNRTSQTIRMLVNGNPACSGDVMPGGYCVESVNPGTYLMQATNGQQTTAGFSCTVQYGQHCDYTVNEQTSQNFNPVKTVNVAAHYTPVNLLNYGPFNVDAPVVLKASAPEQGTTDQGKTYNKTVWSATLPNDDTYMVAVASYPFQIDPADMQRAGEGFRSAVDGRILNQTSVTVSGQPATAFIIEAQVNNRTMRFALLVTYRGNTAYMFVFGTYLDTQDTDMKAMETFFTSVTLN
jgi:hypothetical protein